MKLKQYLAVCLVSVFAFTGAAVDLSQYENWFSCTFSGCSVGDRLADDTGATGGGWGQNVSSLPEAIKISGYSDGKRLDITRNVMNTPVFTADRLRWSSSDLVFRFKAAFKEPEVNTQRTTYSSMKTSFWIGKDSSSKPCFYGYGSDGWVALEDPTGTVSAAFNKIFNILWVIRGGQVAFYIEQDGEQYLLRAVDGRTSLTLAGDGESVSRVEFAGEGSISDFSALYRKNEVGFKIRQ